MRRLHRPSKPARTWPGRSTWPSPASWADEPTRQDTPTRPQQLAQGGRTRRAQGFLNKPASPVGRSAIQPRVSSCPIQAVRWDESPATNDQGNSAPPMPLVSRSVATVPLTYPLTRADVATVPPPSPLTAASGNLIESTVHDSTRRRPADRQDGAQTPRHAGPGRGTRRTTSPEWDPARVLGRRQPKPTDL